MNIDTILEHFSIVDPILADAGKKMRSSLEPITVVDHTAYLSSLCQSIVGQQLSVKAASTIWQRTHSVIDDWNSPNVILAADNSDLRNCGLSYQKIGYIQNVATAIEEKILHIEQFDSISDEEICRELTAVKGIGRWTAEMFLIFTLGREDIFSAGDLGLRNSIAKLYGFGSVSAEGANNIAKKWSPHRSTASRILWAHLDNG